MAGWVFFPMAVSAIAMALLVSVRTRDLMHPMTILLILIILRIGLPTVLVLISEEPEEFYWLSPAFAYWFRGLALALVGVLCMILGWELASSSRLAKLHARGRRLAGSAILDRRSLLLAVVAMLLGAGLVAVFLRLNYLDPSEAIGSGIIRSAEFRTEGTSRYSFAGSHLLIYGATLVTTYLLVTRKARGWAGLVPVLLAAALMTMFGGRVGAVTPLAYGLIVAWYSVSRPHIRPSSLLRTLVLGSLAAYYAAFVVAYRGGGVEKGLTALHFENFSSYLNFSAWYEFGFLHPFALAAYFGPSSLPTPIYPAVGGFVTEIFLGMEATRPGLYLVDSLTGISNAWGIHTGFLVDVFMSSGMIPMVVAAFLFGRVLRSAYETVRAGRSSAFVVGTYAIFLWNSIWVFFESIIVIFPLTLGLLTYCSMVFLSKALPLRRHHVVTATEP